MTYPNPVNLTGISGLFKYADQVTDNYFVPSMLISLWLVVFVYIQLNRNDWKGSSMAAGFITTITAILLRVLEISTNDKYVLIAIVSIIIPLTMSFLSDSST